MIATCRDAVLSLAFPTKLHIVLESAQIALVDHGVQHQPCNLMLLADVPIECLLPTLFVTIPYFMAGFQLSIAQFSTTLAVVLATTLATQAIGVLIAVTALSYRFAQVGASCMLTQNITCIRLSKDVTSLLC